MDSYIFSPVPWKGKDPLRRIKSITPEKHDDSTELVYLITKTNPLYYRQEYTV